MQADPFYEVLIEFLSLENDETARGLYNDALNEEQAPLSQDEKNVLKFIDEHLFETFLGQDNQYIVELGIVERFNNPTKVARRLINNGQIEGAIETGLLDRADPIGLIVGLSFSQISTYQLLDRVEDIYGLKVALLKKRQIDKLRDLGLMFDNESVDGSTECMKLALELLEEGRIGEAIQILSEFEPNELEENNNWVFGVKSLRNVLSPNGVPHSYHKRREEVVDLIKRILMAGNTSQEDGYDIHFRTTFTKAMRTIFEDHDTFGAD